jgi:hypothetical protein
MARAWWGEPAATSPLPLPQRTLHRWVKTRSTIASQWTLHTTAIATLDKLLTGAIDTLEECATDEQVPLVQSVREGLVTYSKQTAWLSEAVVALDDTATKVLRNRDLIQ